MTPLAKSNSLCGLSFADSVWCRCSGVPSFNPLNPASSSSACAGYAEYAPFTSAANREFPVPGSLRRKVGTHDLRRRSWTSSVEKPRRCNVSLKASSTQKSEPTDKEPGSSQRTVTEPPVDSHMDLLERFTSESGLGPTGKGRTIAQQLAEDLQLEEAEDVTVPLGSGKLEIEPLTISQKRNIRRQDYLNLVAERDDTTFFTTVALFVIVPPVAILGVAVATGYIDLFP